MTDTYLVSSFADKDRVKALGARWDPTRRQWYVPEGRELAPFAQWLPAADVPAPVVSRDLLAPSPTASSGLAVPEKKGVSLSQLLQGVSGAVAQAFKAGVWTLVEVVDTRIRNGHVYLEVSERDVSGVITAKANAVIWASTASQILPKFESATGAQIGPGIKLLVRARPVFKPQFGFSIEVDAIDSDYTLGDLEARKREIRERLQHEGLFELNRQLPSPWDYYLVLVVAPEGGAGLGDFQAEAKRLEASGICRFVYVHSRFQGDGAAAEIRMELLGALERMDQEGLHPDAVAIIRGGGAINDMAWLNDYALVRAVCELDVPVLTGIGHERDNTVLDEVANIRFDTPSKVIAGIERLILLRAQEAKSLFDDIIREATHAMGSARRIFFENFTAIEAGARQEIARSRQRTTEMLAQLQLDAVQAVRNGAEQTERSMVDVRRMATHQLGWARNQVPALMAEIRSEARQTLQTARATIKADKTFVLDRAAADVRHMKDAASNAFAEVGPQAHKTVAEARVAAQALIREIAGQGPAKTLSRGFALVRDAAGKAVTSATSAGAKVTIQFRDGTRSATLRKEDKP
ncbi:exonuclease VII, large subunit [Acidovorax sp. CF316]|uniref:exodeoxyribonuclease VII large subunit n=1 Tax=Acidovorax sp. CF316 TaxID=1144317 RepID=UPI00026BE290|nr:exodeoxyribonuclease VII large subunit [Acidovorax sp. CF316]EJE50478.1 exonuclease VII, large subunit [Acidovorax sp. CF316]